MKQLFSKTLILAVIACSVAANYSCDRKPVTGNKSDEVAAAVCKIYDHVFECYSTDNDSAEAFNRRYLSADYLQWIDSVNAFDAAHCDGEIGFWEYDHWILGQDWDTPTYTLDKVSVSDSSTDWYWATVTIHNLGNETQIHLLMVPEDGEWKIGDMLDYGWDTPSEIDRMNWYLRDKR